MNITEAYNLLNLSPTASSDEIRHSFLELSKKYHPDHNTDHVAHEIFIMIKKAYTLISHEKSNDYMTSKNSQEPPKSTPKPTSNNSNTSDNIKKYFSDLNILFGSSPIGLKDVKMTTINVICDKYNIKTKCLSKNTLKPIKKTKCELYIEIEKLQRFKELQQLSYSQLMSLCKEKNISNVRSKQNKLNSITYTPKSLLELFMEIIASP